MILVTKTSDRVRVFVNTSLHTCVDISTPKAEFVSSGSVGLIPPRRPVNGPRRASHVTVLQH